MRRVRLQLLGYSYRSFCSVQREHHPREYWKDKENQKQYLEVFASKNGIRNHSDWYDVTRKQLIDHKGFQLFVYYPNIYELVKQHYPTVEWNPFEFKNISLSDEFWDSKENQLLFISHLKHKFNIKKPLDWNFITKRTIIEQNGYGFMRKYSSLNRGLEILFPDEDWKTVKFIPFHLSYLS